MYTPLFTRRFEKQIKKLPRHEQSKILSAIEQSMENPRKASVKLTGTDPVIYRLRVGEYRAFFSLDDKEKTMKITDAVRRTTTTY